MAVLFHCFIMQFGAVAQCPYNWGVGSAFHLTKIHIFKYPVITTGKSGIQFKTRPENPDIILVDLTIKKFTVYKAQPQPHVHTQPKEDE